MKLGNGAPMGRNRGAPESAMVVPIYSRRWVPPKIVQKFFSERTYFFANRVFNLKFSKNRGAQDVHKCRMQPIMDSVAAIQGTNFLFQKFFSERSYFFANPCFSKI